MEQIKLKLYITDHNKRSVAAIVNLTRLIEGQIVGRYDLEIIDVLKDGERAQKDKILATPTLVCHLPNTLTKIIGDLSETEKIMTVLEFNN